MLELDKIYNEDCLIGMKKIDDKSIDMILVDPPYQSTNNSWDVRIPIKPMLDEFFRVIKDNGAILIFSQLPFAVDLINHARKFFRYEWIWEKVLAVGFLNARKMPLRCHENILVFYKKLPTYNPQFEFRKPIKNKKMGLSPSLCYGKQHSPRVVYNSPDGKRFPRDVLKWAGVRSEHDEHGNFIKNLHPTQKPVSLLIYMIQTFSNPDEIILDACMGSGSTAIACLNTNRHFIGFETDPNYFSISQNRIQEEISKKMKD